jgi:Flp pilus assembly protein TadG
MVIRLGNRRGAAMVEFSIASVIFFLLVFSAVAFGQAINRYNIVSNAARSAVRWAIVRGSSSGQTAATASDIHDYIVTKMNGVAETDSVTWSSGTVPGSTVQVVVRSTYTISIPRAPSYTVLLRSQAQMNITR